VSIEYINDGETDRKVLGSDGLILVFFTAPWCSACKSFSQTLNEIAEEKEGKLTIYKMDIDENATFANSYSVRSLPTTLAFKDGLVQDTKIGVATKQDFLKFINKL